MQTGQLLLGDSPSLLEGEDPRLEEHLVGIGVPNAGEELASGQDPLDLSLKTAQLVCELREGGVLVQNVRPLLRQARYLLKLGGVDVVGLAHLRLVQVP